MAGQLRHWKERNGRYSARLVVPRKLRPYLDGKTELEIQLGGDKREAIRNHAAAVAAIQHQIGIARQKHAAATGQRDARPSYPLSATQMAVRDYLSLIQFDDEVRRHDHHFADSMVDERLVTDLRAGMAGRLTDDELDELIGYRIERFRLRGNTGAAKGSPEWRDLAMKLCVSEYEALARHFERNDGDFTGRPEHPMLAAAIEQEDTTAGIVTFDQIIDEEVARRARGKDAKEFSKTTIKKYRNPAAHFAKFRGSDNAATVTADEGKRWIAAMQDAGKLANKTIKINFQNVRTILTWGRKNDPKSFLPSGNPLIDVRTPDYRSKPSYLSAFTLQEAKLVLGAARSETMPMLRWIPWLCAYSGMRVSEAGSLEKEDFFEHSGRWFWRVTTVGRRSLKTYSSERRIPVHKTLVDEGLLLFVQSALPGRLFRGSTKIDVQVQPRLSTWVRRLIPTNERPELKPNHGWRHLFEDFCRRDGVPEDARKYMTGRTDGSSQEMYGRSDVMLAGLADAMDKIRPIEIS